MARGPRTSLTIVAVALAAAAAILPRPPAGAATILHQTGISGYSGNPATGGATCIVCHSGGLAPTTAITGPLTVATGNQVTYELRITSGQQIAGGFDVSAAAGTLVVADADTQRMNGEITHTRPRDADLNGEVAFLFDWVAPAVAGTYTLYGAGNSVNRDFTTSGDSSDKHKISVVVKDSTVTFTKYGVGLAGSGGFVPRLNGVNGTGDGNYSVKVSKGLGGAFGYVIVGLGMDHLPFFGGRLLVDLSQGWWLAPVQLGGVPGVPGDGILDLPGADVRDFLGLTLYLQGAFLDAGALRGVSLTSGLEMVVA